MFCTIASTIKTQKEEVAEEVQFKGPFAYDTVQSSANLSSIGTIWSAEWDRRSK
jgi:hypothetical protein